MIKILFVCHGNICRSPMAEFVMKQLVRERGLQDEFIIQSAATSREEIGNPVYPPAQRALRQHGVPFGHRAAVQMTKADYGKYDYLVGMDRQNLRNMLQILGSDPQGKASLLLDFTGNPRDVADPWYSGDFEATFRDVTNGCEALLAHILNQE